MKLNSHVIKFVVLFQATVTKSLSSIAPSHNSAHTIFPSEGDPPFPDILWTLTVKQDNSHQRLFHKFPNSPLECRKELELNMTGTQRKHFITLYR